MKVRAIASGTWLSRFVLRMRGRAAVAPVPVISERFEVMSANVLAGNVLARRNPFFTGRERLLTTIHARFARGDTLGLTRTQTIRGGAGIGKTQAAIEYAARYRDDYEHILWVNAANRTTLTSDFVALAHRLELPEKDEPDQRGLVAAVRRWLTENEPWLLLLDNADDLDLVREFLPATSKGHALLTTSTPAVEVSVNDVTVGKMGLPEAALFLLRRARVLSTSVPLDQTIEEERAKAEAIAVALEGLPLAFEHAGAYIREMRCNLATYLDRYLMQRKRLRRRQESLAAQHPAPVKISLSLSLQRIEQDRPLAADLLRLCAFLSPDAIPEEILSKGSVEFGSMLRPVAGDPLKLHEAVEQLEGFSLLRRIPDTQLLSISRPVQALLQAEMKKATRQQFARKAVRAVALAFTDVDKRTQLDCQPYLPQVETCAALCEQYRLAFAEAAQLFNEAASYLQDHARYVEAEALYWRVLVMRERMLGPEDPFTASSMNNLALLYRTQGKYEQAEQLYQQALLIYETALGPRHPFTASSLHNLALLYHEQGKYAQAEQCYERSLAIRERVVGAEHLDTVNLMEHYAALLTKMDRGEEAAKLEVAVKAIRDKPLPE